MRGLLLSRYRRRRYLGLTLVLMLLYVTVFQESSWIKRIVEDKVAFFLGDRLSVRIGEVRGGVFSDMILQNVTFSAGEGEGEKVFRLERMEISYRLWWVILEKIRWLSGKEQPLKYISVYFSKNNSFVRGFIKLCRSRENIELVGHISPVLFGEERKRGIKGTFHKREDGKYDCDLLWDGTLKITGTLDPFSRAVDLGFVPLSKKKGNVKVKVSIDENRNVRVYSRVDKVNIFGTEIIGDLWAMYRDSERPLFSLRAENMVVDRRPFWDFAVKGEIFPVERTIVLDNVRWGDGLILRGTVNTFAPYTGKLELLIKSLELKELGGMLGQTKTPFAGVAKGEIEFLGPIKTAAVKGRLYVGEGVMGNMSFRSMFATLTGKLPVIKVTDSRVVKEGRHIIVSGEMDFSKLKENGTFSELFFETDNKVAVWEEWQILKEEEDHLVEARKDNLTFSTSIEDETIQEEPGSKTSVQKGMGFEYKLDASNSIKLEVEEEKDFLGLQHKIQF